MTVSTVTNGDLLTLAVNSSVVLVNHHSLLCSTSAVDVIHSVADPSVATKIDCIPSRYTSIEAVNDGITGTRNSQCSELCGSLHGFMAINRTII